SPRMSLGSTTSRLCSHQPALIRAGNGAAPWLPQPPRSGSAVTAMAQARIARLPLRPASLAQRLAGGEGGAARLAPLVAGGPWPLAPPLEHPGDAENTRRPAPR